MVIIHKPLRDEGKSTVPDVLFTTSLCALNKPLDRRKTEFNDSLQRKSCFTKELSIRRFYFWNVLISEE